MEEIVSRAEEFQEHASPDTSRSEPEIQISLEDGKVLYRMIGEQEAGDEEDFNNCLYQSLNEVGLNFEILDNREIICHPADAEHQLEYVTPEELMGVVATVAAEWAESAGYKLVVTPAYDGPLHSCIQRRPRQGPFALWR